MNQLTTICRLTNLINLQALQLFKKNISNNSPYTNKEDYK